MMNNCSTDGDCYNKLDKCHLGEKNAPQVTAKRDKVSLCTHLPQSN